MLSLIVYGGFKLRKFVLYLGLICGGRTPSYVWVSTGLYLYSDVDFVNSLWCAEEIA